MALPFELIALDLDYTLLDDRHQISARNLTAVRHCRDLGATVVVSSGRMYRSTLPYAQTLGVDAPLVTYNGAFIKRERTGEVLLHEHLDTETARMLIDFCRREELNLNYYLDDNLYIAKPNPWADLYARRTGVPLHPVGDLRTLADRPPTKALIVDDPVRIAHLHDALAPRYAERAYVTISNVEYLEFMPPAVDKGKALARVAEHLGIPRNKVIAFGDANNDIPMIGWAGMGVAMANAKPGALSVADRVAPGYDEDGVAVVLEEIFAPVPRR